MLNRSSVLILTGLLLGLLACSNGSDSSDAASISTPGWSATSAQPSPDGQHVAFIGWPETGDIARRRLVLAGDHPLEIGIPGTLARSFAWMPSSDAILLAYSDEMGGDSPTRFAIVDLEGRVVREIPVERGLNTSNGIAVSPDGSRAAMPATELGWGVATSTMWTLDLESGVLEEFPIDDPGAVFQAHPRFAGDDRIVMNAGEPLATAGTNGWVGVLDLESGAVVRLTGPEQTSNVPSVTPDGRYVVFDAFPGNARSQRALWYAPLDGSAPPSILIDRLAGRAPSLEPDGRSVLLIDAGAPGERSVIRRVDIPDDAPWLAGDETVHD